MREMGWSWDELEATPMYVRQFCWDISQIRRVNQAQRVSNRGQPR